VDEGRKDLGTDPHSWLRDLIGTDIIGEGDPGRDNAKTGMYACVPMDTRALTRRGWKRPEELILGEDILTYNPEKCVKEWQPLLEVVTYADAPLIRMKHGHSFEVVSTPNHRWFVNRRTGSRTRYMVPDVRTTEDLSRDCSIIVNAPMGPDQDTVTGNGGWLMHHDKYERTAWDRAVLRMNQAEREAFLAGFLIADGHHRGRTWQWSQNDGPLAEAAILASYLVSPGKVHIHRKASPNRRDPHNEILTGLLNAKGHTTCQTIIKEDAGRAPVWCPRTENGSWVMRQGDCITITGNTLYGAGALKMGSIVKPHASDRDKLEIGRVIQAKMAERFVAKTKLQQAIEAAVLQNGFLYGLDKRVLRVRKAHAALNTLLQSAGAVVMKRALVILDRNLQQSGLIPGKHYEFVGNIHDEAQAEVLPESVELFREKALECLPLAGKSFRLNCPLKAEVEVGRNWADTH
jgi:hypothetical protein